MRRIAIVLAVLALVGAGCGGGGTLEPGTSGASTIETTVPSTTETSTSGASTTGAPVTTAGTTTTETTAPLETSTSTTTTTTVDPGPVTTDASLPTGALGRGLIPWDDVDGSWVLALYSGDRVVGSYADGPTVLYLVGPDADVYEITAWPASAREPWAILDWSPDRRRALVHVGPDAPPDDDRRVVLVELATGARSDVATFPEATWTVEAGFTMPTGRNVVIGTDDGVTERLEVYRAGAANAVLVERPSEAASISWLYGQAGTTVVVSDVDGIRLLDNQGSFIRDLDTPGVECLVPRWWTAHGVLAACIPPAEYAAGNWYHQLWLVPDDGSAATPMSTVPGGIIVVDFGLIDAWPAGGDTLVQWRGDCSASSVETLQSDGTGMGIPAAFPVAVGGFEMVSPQGSALAVRYWDDCGQTQSWLGQIELDGTFLGELIEKVADRAGVISAVELG